MKSKLPILFIATVALTMFSCNSDSGLPEPEPEKPAACECPQDNVFSDFFTFTESELNQISSLIDSLPYSVEGNFNIKYISWESVLVDNPDYGNAWYIQLWPETWRWEFPDIKKIIATQRILTESEEYESLLNYCKEYGKAVFPLIFERMVDANYQKHIVIVLEELTSTEYKDLFEETLFFYNCLENVGLDFYNIFWKAYSKRLFEQEYDNILKSIQEIPKPPLGTEYTELDMDKIATLKDHLPAIVKTDFNEKYLEWKDTWKRPEISIHSNMRKYAESEEYESLLTYCKIYGKAIWPLIFEKLENKTTVDINLLEDLVLSENRPLYDDIFSYLSNIDKRLPYKFIIWIACANKLLEKEYDNILKSIQDISIPVL